MFDSLYGILMVILLDFINNTCIRTQKTKQIASFSVMKQQIGFSVKLLQLSS